MSDDAPATDGTGTQAFIGSERPDPERFDPPTNTGPAGLSIKPDGGLWTSTLRDDGGCAWLDWCRTNKWFSDDDRLYALEPRDDVDVYVIDGMADLAELLDTYERNDGVHWRISAFAPVDFEAIADDYDGVHLTDRGQARTRFGRPGLYGWDAESTVWLRWVFENVADRGPVAERVAGGE